MGSNLGPGARRSYPLSLTAADGTAFVAKAMAGGAESNTVRVNGFDYVTVFVDTEGAGGQSVTIQCFVGDYTELTPERPVAAETLAAGVATLDDYIPTRAVSTTPEKLPPVVFPVLGADIVRIVVTAAAGTCTLRAVARNT